MSRARAGDTVRVNYTGRFDDGAVFDSSKDRSPLEFTLGAGQVIQGFEQAVIGMNPGDLKTTHIASDSAFGPRRDDLVHVIARERLPEDIDPKVGERYAIRQGDSESILVTISEASDESVTLDANHPLAGRDLNFDIELVEILK